LVRSVTHEDRTHTSAGYTMLTGAAHPLANASSAQLIQPSPNDHPHIGSLLCKVRRPRRDVPTFVALPEIIKDANVNLFPGQDGGFLGKACSPLLIEANLQRTAFLLPDLLLPADISAARLAPARRHSRRPPRPPPGAARPVRAPPAAGGAGGEGHGRLVSQGLRRASLARAAPCARPRRRAGRDPRALRAAPVRPGLSA